MAYIPIGNLPDAPQRGEDRETFKTKANAWVADLQNWTDDVNASGLYIEESTDIIHADRIFVEAVGAKNRGTWQNATTVGASYYAIGDGVVYSSIRYYNLTGTNTDTAPDTDTTNWNKMTGSGSGLDADKLDGFDSTHFIPYSAQGTLDVANSAKLGGILANQYKRILSNNIEVTVGSGGDYSTINEALEYLVRTYYPIYKNTGITATINLLTGFTMAEQVLVRGLNLGWITITGDDAETTIDHTALTTNFPTVDYGLASYPAFGVSKGGTLPRVGQMFRFSATGVGGEKHGVMAIGAGSSAEILPSCGIINAGTYGVYAANGSTINAIQANASGAGQYGIYATGGSTINAETANCSNAGARGVCAANGSTINAYGANASGAGQYGIYAHRASIINADVADASGAGYHGIFAVNSSTINAYGAIIRDQTTGTARVRVLNGSHIGASPISTTGGTAPVFSQAVNTLTGEGIIYQ